MNSGFLQQSLFPPADFASQTYTLRNTTLRNTKLRNTKLSNAVIIKHHAVGVLEIIPSKVKSAMVISSGIHGNETLPVELVDALVEAIVTEGITPSCRTLFIIAHSKAIHEKKRFIDENLNRLFSADLQLDRLALAQTEKNATYNQEQKLMRKLQFYMRQFYSALPSHVQAWHLDLHSTIRQSKHNQFAVIPSSVSHRDAKKINTFCQHAKIEAALLASTPSNTFSWWSGAYFNAIAATIELGQVSPLYQNDLSQYQRVKDTLLSMLCNKKLPALNESSPFTQYQFTQYQVSRTLYKHDASFAFIGNTEPQNFTFFPENEGIAIENGIEIRANARGEAIVFPNPNVAIGQRAALLVQEVKHG